MHDLLFQHETHLDDSALRAYADQLELDLGRFDAELADRIYRQRVNEHVDGARRSGVRGTPTFFVADVLVDVSFGLDRLFKAVRARLT